MQNEEMSFVRRAAFLLIRGCSSCTCALLSWLCADMVHDEGDWGWQAAKCLFTCSWLSNANALVLDKWERDAAIMPRLTFSVCMRQRSVMELSHASCSGPHHYRTFFFTLTILVLYNSLVWVVFIMGRRALHLSFITSWENYCENVPDRNGKMWLINSACND